MAQTFIVPNPQRYRFSAATSSNLKKPLLHGRLTRSLPQRARHSASWPEIHLGNTLFLSRRTEPSLKTGKRERSP
jgi:hypothetical protein